jgi:hypothetical protein
MTRRRALIAVFAGSVVAILAGYYGLNEMLRVEAKNGPVSTIGRSGDFKSPGGTSEEAEERRRPG